MASTAQDFENLDGVPTIEVGTSQTKASWRAAIIGGLLCACVFLPSYFLKIVAVVLGPPAALGFLIYLLGRSHWSHTSSITFGHHELTFNRRFARAVTVERSKIRDIHLGSPAAAAASRRRPGMTWLRVTIGGRRSHIVIPLKRIDPWAQLLETDDQLPFTGVKHAGGFERTKKREMTRANFEGYLASATPTNPTDLRGVTSWLAQNPTYSRDRGGDEWLTPDEFERRNTGDCEDHAIWAWTKLHALGYEPEFVIGWFRSDYIFDKNPWEFHAWVRYADNGQLINLEATTKIRDMGKLWAHAKDRYVPQYTVTASLECFYYPESDRPKD